MKRKGAGLVWHSGWPGDPSCAGAGQGDQREGELAAKTEYEQLSAHDCDGSQSERELGKGGHRRQFGSCSGHAGLTVPSGESASPCFATLRFLSLVFTRLRLAGRGGANTGMSRASGVGPAHANAACRSSLEHHAGACCLFARLPRRDPLGGSTVGCPCGFAEPGASKGSLVPTMCVCFQT